VSPPADLRSERCLAYDRHPVPVPVQSRHQRGWCGSVHYRYHRHNLSFIAAGYAGQLQVLGGEDLPGLVLIYSCGQCAGVRRLCVSIRRLKAKSFVGVRLLHEKGNAGASKFRSLARLFHSAAIRITVLPQMLQLVPLYRACYQFLVIFNA